MYISFWAILILLCGGGYAIFLIHFFSKTCDEKSTELCELDKKVRFYEDTFFNLSLELGGERKDKHNLPSPVFTALRGINVSEDSDEYIDILTRMNRELRM